MPVRVHPDKSGLTSCAFVATGSDCAYCWAASAAVHSSAERVQAATPTTPSSATTGIKRHEMEITQRSTALTREASQSGRGRYISPASAAGSLLPDLEIVAHLFDAVDGARKFAGPGLHGRRIDEPGQLHHTLLRSHVDLVRLGRRIPRELSLDRRCQHAVIDVLASRRIGLRADAKVVANLLDARDRAGHLRRLLFLLGVVDEASELNDATIRLDVDLAGLGDRIVDQGNLHLGGQYAVVDDLSGRLLRARGGAGAGHRQHSQDCGEFQNSSFHAYFLSRCRSRRYLRCSAAKKGSTVPNNASAATPPAAEPSPVQPDVRRADLNATRGRHMKKPHAPSALDNRSRSRSLLRVLGGAPEKSSAVVYRSFWVSSWVSSGLRTFDRERPLRSAASISSASCSLSGAASRASSSVSFSATNRSTS